MPYAPSRIAASMIHQPAAKSTSWRSSLINGKMISAAANALRLMKFPAMPSARKIFKCCATSSRGSKAGAAGSAAAAPQR